MKRRVAPIVSAVCACVSTAVAPAAAQPRSGTVFVDGAALAVVDEAPEIDAQDLLSATGTGGTVPGGGFGVGVHLSQHLSVRAEVHLAALVRQSRDLPSVLEGVSFPPGNTPFAISQTLTTKRKSTPVFALLAYHLPARRVSVELASGLGLVRQSVTSTYETVITGPGLGLGGFTPQPLASEFSSSGYHAVAVVGADVAVAATSHLAVVPQVRAYALNSGLSLRPGIGLRWTF